MTTRKWTKAHKQAHSEAMKTNWAKRKAKQLAPASKVSETRRTMPLITAEMKRVVPTAPSTPRYLAETARKLNAISDDLANLATDLRMLAL